MKPTTGEYPRWRRNTLRGIERTAMLKAALKLARENQSNGKHYPRKVLKILGAAR